MIAADAGHRLNHATTVAFGTQNGRVTVGGATDTLNGLVTVEARRWDGSSTPTTATSGRWCVTTAASAGTTWLGLLTAPVDTVVVRTSRAALTAWAPNTAVMRLDACQRSRRNNDIRGGNATLDPMSGVVAEVGWRSRTSQSVTRMTWDVSAFYARLRDEILSLDDPAAPGNSLTTNIDKTTHAGVEALRGATVEAGATHRVEPMVSVTLTVAM